ncbi:cache domain-containing protein [Vibrio sinaloensis]|nr:cache domain-containing protein [Vibrio sinaloensis]
MGTGEYVADVENDIKAALLSSIAGYQQDHDEKVFIFDDAGTVLVHEDAMLVGKSVESLNRSMNVEDELVQKAQFEPRLLYRTQPDG